MQRLSAIPAESPIAADDKRLEVLDQPDFRIRGYYGNHRESDERGHGAQFPRGPHKALWSALQVGEQLHHPFVVSRSVCSHLDLARGAV
jgi:hypothetical protein